MHCDHTLDHSHILFLLLFIFVLLLLTRSGVLRTQKSKSPLLRTREVKSFAFKVRNRSEYRQAYFSHCQEFLSFWFLYNFRSIQSHFFRNLPLGFFLALGVANRGSRVGPRNQIGHLGRYHDAGVLDAPYTCDLRHCLVSIECVQS